MALLSEAELSHSDVVANCRMNRERVLRGGNGYVRELGLDPVAFLAERLERRRQVAWLDLCCGAALALGEAAVELGDRAKLVGVDRWRRGAFRSVSSSWRPTSLLGRRSGASIS